MIDWIENVHKNWHDGWIAVASGVAAIDESVVATIAKIVAPLVVAALCGVSAWLMGGMIDLKAANAGHFAVDAAQAERIAANERRIAEFEARLASIAEDRWRRRDQASYAVQIETRLQALEHRSSR